MSKLPISSTTMTMNLAASDNIARLLYLQRMKDEMLHVREQVDQKLHNIEKAIQECQQCVPSPSLWSRISSYIIKTASSLCNGVTIARTKKSLKNLFLEKIIIPPRKSIPFNVIKRVQ